MKLTRNQRIFCDEYLIDLNATRAYKVAYKRVKKDATARTNASRLLTNANVKKYIESKMKEREKRTEITQDMVLQELAKIGFAKLDNYLDYKTALTQVGFSDGEPVFDYSPVINLIDSKEVDTSVVQEVSISDKGTFKFKLYDKQKALELIGKHLGMFTEKIEHSGGLDIQVQWGNNED